MVASRAAERSASAEPLASGEVELRVARPQVEAGRVALESLQAFAGEQRLIIASDRRSFEHLAQRFTDPAAGSHFVVAVGLGDEYEPLAGCQAYPAYVAWLALSASAADVALAFLANLESWDTLADGLH